MPVSRRVRRIAPLGPLFTVAFGLALFYLWTLVAPLHQTWSSAGFTTPFPLSVTRVYPIGHVVRGDSGIEVVPILGPPVPASTPVAALLTTRTRSRFFAYVGERWKYHFEIGPSTHGLTPAEMDRARALSAQYLATDGNGGWAVFVPLFSPADTSTGRVIWSGVLIDIAALICIVGFFLSFGWIPVAIAVCQEWYRAKLLAQKGQCVACGYSLAGLPSQVCPECGAWNKRLSAEPAAGDSAVL